MCGIAGYFGAKQIEESAINHTLQLMQNRGPDARGMKKFTSDNLNCYLLHSRLSIIDLEERSNQPMSFDNITIAYNGEIYNYIEIREILQKKGYVFHTGSDTEVVLKAFHRWGEHCVDYFEGMWSMAIYNQENQTLFLSRDRFAEKPLYYHIDEHGIYFASETKYIRSLSQKKFSKNIQQVLRYIINTHKSLYKQGETFYETIKELDYASSMVINNQLSYKTHAYWHPKYMPDNKITEKDAVENIREKLIHSVKLRLRSDVPIAFCLSGGVDSSSLISIAAKVFNYDVHSFSIIDKDERYNELDNITATINDTGIKNTKILLSPNEKNIDKLKQLIDYHDAPLATISYFVHSFLSEAIHKQGYKISVSGTAADELFTGYYDHFNLFLYDIKNESIYQERLAEWEKYVKPYVRNPYLRNPLLYYEDSDFRKHIYLNSNYFRSFFKDTKFNERFIEKKMVENSLLRNRMLNELFYEVVRVILHEDDLNSMFYSIENRSPFLDKNLFEYAYSVPSKFLIKNGYNKYLLRQAMQGILNDKVRLSREKKGFNADIKSIIDLNDERQRSYLLDDSEIYNYFDKQKIEKLLKKEEFPNSFKKFLFNFINAKIFLG